MATHKMNMFEKIANMLGCLYRHQAAQFPRRCWKHELAPPKTTDWPAIKADWKKVSDFILTRKYKELTVREFLVYTAVSMEIVFWFFIGEMIGRRHIAGYLVPANYVSKETRKKSKLSKPKKPRKASIDL
ncbi:putative ATP synthase subunit g 2, mitochondrial [Parelaphostrongylus tenuis]|uniref:ATP synthase subunit g 2, mitochondrial n=1 Tax=Parelaphostrongylus tenuis TaxID=148309 RepID=A0AAD5N6S9_PARTN|nr:putative ATP synthase subunit g 2, mitochondrial [Parelaphostrongylus tenuis]